MKFNSLKKFIITAEGTITIAVLIVIFFILIAFNFNNYFHQIDWGAMFGAIGSLSAAGIALFTVWFQIYKYNNDRKPAISPLTKDVHLHNLNLHDDWDTEEKITVKWSLSKLDVGNFGSIPIIDMEYVFSLDNFENVREEVENTNKVLSLKESIEKDSDFHMKLFKKKRAEDSYNETLYVSTAAKRDKRTHKTKYKIGNPIVKTNAIRPNETIEINLPSYFIVLNNYIQLALSKNMFSYDITNVPKLSLVISCTDIDQRKWNVVHQIYMYDSFNGNEKYGPTGITTTHNFQIVFTHIKTKKIK